MWTIKIERKAEKELDKAPAEIRRKFEAWKRHAQFGGVKALVAINGFRDHALKGEWRGFRSSSLSDSWRVIYFVDGETISILVVRISNHDYR